MYDKERSYILFPHTTQAVNDSSWKKLFSQRTTRGRHTIKKKNEPAHQRDRFKFIIKCQGPFLSPSTEVALRVTCGFGSSLELQEIGGIVSQDTGQLAKTP